MEIVRSRLTVGPPEEPGIFHSISLMNLRSPDTSTSWTSLSPHTKIRSGATLSTPTRAVTAARTLGSQATTLNWKSRRTSLSKTPRRYSCTLTQTTYCPTVMGLARKSPVLLSREKLPSSGAEAEKLFLKTIGSYGGGVSGLGVTPFGPSEPGARVIFPPP